MRRIAFAHTSPRVLDESKTVTRRRGWLHIKPGDLLQAVDRSWLQKPGDRAQLLKVIRVESIRRERLDAITAEDVVREGFPDMSPAEFVAMFAEIYGCGPADQVTRIEFSYVH